jgi:PTH1 family peptidyl-tRNA hydrolase
MIVGLGNPGPRYEMTRHNIGFLVVDELARRFGVAGWKTKDGAAHAQLAARRVVLLKPQTFMNDSGTPTSRASHWYKVDAARMLVVSDDIDLPFGRMRMRASGSSGGQNGLKSIIEHFGEGFARLRLGIGREAGDPIDYVLAPFSKDERPALATIVETAANAAERWLSDGPQAAMQDVNGWRLPSDLPPGS